ncbi:MAG: cellulase family glycosylhydrolase [Candidatus Symbiothrix sp.]|jgi:hypothetical protein|nr:cellulase family glycosylhydrolase [Candidatus Symbiothrix sp.]
MYSKIKYLIFGLIFTVAGADLRSQNSTADGYKGIWYTIEQSSEYGYKYSGGLGTYTADHIPMAIYSPEADKTFFTYGGTPASDKKQLQIMVSYYDHTKNIVPKPVIVYDKKGVDDPHDNASLAIDSGGYIWVFISGRNVSRIGLIFKSREPYSIEAFDKVHETIMTYPQPWWIPAKGFIHLFTQYTAEGTRGRELYWSTSNDGVNWSDNQKLAGIEGHYQISNVWKDKVVTAFNYHPDGHADKRTNIYLAQTSDMGRSWQNIAGETLQTPLTDPKTSALVYDYESEGKLVYLNDLNFDKEGNPIILAIISNHFQPGPKGDPREWTIFHRKNNEWKKHKVCQSTHNYDMGALYVNGDEWLIAGPTDAGPQQYGTGGEMALWKSNDEGKSWKKIKQITGKSVYNHSYARRPLNAHRDFYAYWADGDADKFSESRLYFTNKKGNKVWMLPYDMENDFVKPIRIKETFRMNNTNNKSMNQPFGVNLACAEFAEGHIPGEYGKHYTYPDAKELDYFKSKGLMLVRLPFKWERLQPELFGKLDKVELDRIKNFISEADKRGMYVILDLHNYGRRYVDGKKTIIGTDNLKVEHFADFWEKLAKEMKNHTNIYGHGLMNEPHDMEESESCWFEMAQSAITAIRKMDMKKTIIVGGDDWSSAERWLEQSDTLKHLIDPANNLMFEAHVYFDNDASGGYKKSYDEEGCTPDKGVNRVKPFVEWLKENDFKGMIGEYGVPHTDERWLETMDNFLSYLQKEGVNATYWAAGPWWGNYVLRLTPTNGEDRPQMKVVEKYLYTTPNYISSFE